MKCSLTGQNTRILAKAINSFSRIGNDLYLEANVNGMSLRAVNDAQTAFAEITFELGFFTDFKIDRSSSDQYSNKCKISMKSCLSVFKNMRQVEQCLITLNSRTSKLLFQFNCLFDTIKTHNVSILEQETLRNVHRTDNVPNRMTAPNKLFTDIISNFRMYDKEITIEAATDLVVLKNHIDMDTDKHLMRTKLTLKCEEFQEYSITEPTTITFCLRELRGILNFADALSLDMTVNFESAGKAVVFAFGSDDAFKAHFVMSTLETDEASHYNQTNQNITKAQNDETNNTNSRNQSTTQNLTLRLSDVIDLDADDHNECFPPIIATTVVPKPNPPANIQQKEKDRLMRPEKSDASVFPATIATTVAATVATTVPGTVLPQSNQSILPAKDQRSRSRSPSRSQTTSSKASSTPILLAKETESAEIVVTFREESDDVKENSDVEIPASPQPERKRRLKKWIARCYQDTQYAENLSGRILAENTDDEI